MEDKDFNFKMIYLNQNLLQVFKDGRIRKKVGGCAYYKNKGWSFVVGCATKDDYRKILVNKKQYCFHRIIAHTFLDYDISRHDKVIDHIDGDKNNNRLDNLRVLTQKQNSHNNCKNGVYIYKGKWCADLTIFDKRFRPTFDTEQEAREWRDKVKTIQLNNITLL